jgi:hypothetical protein
MLPDFTEHFQQYFRLLYRSDRELPHSKNLDSWLSYQNMHHFIFSLVAIMANALQFSPHEKKQQRQLRLNEHRSRSLCPFSRSSARLSDGGSYSETHRESIAAFLFLGTAGNPSKELRLSLF